VNECDNARAISRFAAVVQLEEPLEKMLIIVRKHKNGVNKRELVMTLTKRGYREKVIGQLMYLGLIAETNYGGSYYSITEKGCKVLDACGR
jgi:predicted transcriptional regulator